jgi:hypothetical protein
VDQRTTSGEEKPHEPKPVQPIPPPTQPGQQASQSGKLWLEKFGPQKGETPTLVVVVKKNEK